MGVKTTVNGIVPAPTDPASVAATGDDFNTLVSLISSQANDLINVLTRLQNLLTANGDSANATTVGTQITALS